VAVLQARQAAKAEKAKVVKTATVAGPTAETDVEQAATAQELSLEADVALRHAPVPDGRGPRGSITRPGVTAIGSLTAPGKATVEGKIRVVEIRPVERNSVLAVEINDATGNLTAMFYGRSHIPGLVCGARVRLSGSVGIRGGQPVMINPAYELVAPGE